MDKQRLKILRMARHKEVSFAHICQSLDISMDMLRDLLDSQMVELITIHNTDLPYSEITLQTNIAGEKVCEIDDDRRKAIRREWYMLVIGALLGFALDRLTLILP